MFASMIPTLGWARLVYFAALRGVYIVGFSVGGAQTDGRSGPCRIRTSLFVKRAAVSFSRIAEFEVEGHTEGASRDSPSFVACAVLDAPDKGLPMDGDWERHGLFRTGAFQAARIRRPSIQYSGVQPGPNSWPPNIPGV
jgi:hypothetical protein